MTNETDVVTANCRLLKLPTVQSCSEIQVNRCIRYRLLHQRYTRTKPKTLAHAPVYLYSIPRQRQPKRDRQKSKAETKSKKYLPQRPKIDYSSSRSIIPLASPHQPPPHPNPSQLPHGYLQHNNTRRCPRVRGNSCVHPLRGTDRVGLPVRVGVFFEGCVQGEGEGVVVGEFGLEEELGLEEEGGQEQRRNKDVLSPNTQKTTDGGRLIDHEIEPKAEMDALRPPS